METKKTKINRVATLREKGRSTHKQLEKLPVVNTLRAGKKNHRSKQTFLYLSLEGKYPLEFKRVHIEERREEGEREKGEEGKETWRREKNKEEEVR